MAKFSRIEVVLKAQESGVIPVYYHSNPDTFKKVLKASYDGGIRAFEFLNRGDGAYEVFTEVIKYARKEMPELVFGAGTLVDAASTAMYIQAGADFIVSPILNAEMAKVCNRRKILWIPGCATVSEINYAEELGAEICKIFPAGQVGGPDFIKSVKGPCPWSNLMPSGGVEPNEENLSKWFIAGAFCVGMGSQLFKKDIIEKGDFATFQDKIEELVKIIKKIKSK
jgi:2-dehydro-3-deoxyphosphogluconate aldolase / (4S)-4-hydroxy-2-oxoglutarate aldolase